MMTKGKAGLINFLDSAYMLGRNFRHQHVEVKN